MIAQQPHLSRKEGQQFVSFEDGASASSKGRPIVSCTMSSGSRQSNSEDDEHAGRPRSRKSQAGARSGHKRAANRGNSASASASPKRRKIGKDGKAVKGGSDELEIEATSDHSNDSRERPSRSTGRAKHHAQAAAAAGIPDDGDDLLDEENTVSDDERDEEEGKKGVAAVEPKPSGKKPKQLTSLFRKLGYKQPPRAASSSYPQAEPMHVRASFLEMHMRIALMAATRSEEHATKVGCAVTDSKLVLSGVGYNAYHRAQGPLEPEESSSPPLTEEQVMDRERARAEQIRQQPSHFASYPLTYGTVVFELRECLDEEMQFDFRHHFSVHAEMNAILHCNVPLQSHRNGWIFVTLIPCPMCFKHIVQTGIKNVVYLDDNFKYPDTWKQASSHNIALIPYKLFCLQSTHFHKTHIESVTNMFKQLCGDGGKKSTPKIFFNVPEGHVKSAIGKFPKSLPNKAMYIKHMALYVHDHSKEDIVTKKLASKRNLSWLADVLRITQQPGQD